VRKPSLAKVVEFFYKERELQQRQEHHYENKQIERKKIDIEKQRLNQEAAEMRQKENHRREQLFQMEKANQTKQAALQLQQKAIQQEIDRENLREARAARTAVESKKAEELSFGWRVVQAIIFGQLTFGVLVVGATSLQSLGLRQSFVHLLGCAHWTGLNFYFFQIPTASTCEIMAAVALCFVLVVSVVVFIGVLFFVPYGGWMLLCGALAFTCYHLADFFGCLIWHFAIELLTAFFLLNYLPTYCCGNSNASSAQTTVVSREARIAEYERQMYWPRRLQLLFLIVGIASLVALTVRYCDSFQGSCVYQPLTKGLLSTIRHLFPKLRL
jgi:hypothetical protein